MSRVPTPMGWGGYDAPVVVVCMYVCNVMQSNAMQCNVMSCHVMLCMYVCNVCMYACMDVCIYVFIYVCIFISIYMLHAFLYDSVCVRTHTYTIYVNMYINIWRNHPI